MAAEYTRIQARVREDPGTAGDEGEENWASLLRNWLPATYPVVTKGRIINEAGETSPQLDVLVLRPDYPLHLRGKKMFLSGGVVAAFECKLTLRRVHLKKVVKTCRVLKKLYRAETGTPFRELQRPILYGVLAHAHAWQRGEHGARFGILESLENAVFEAVEHPAEMPDVLCVVSATTLVISKWLCIRPHLDADSAELFPPEAVEGGVATCYFSEAVRYRSEMSHGTVLGTLIGHITYVLACYDASLRPYASYFVGSQVMGGGLGRPVGWSADTLSVPVRTRVRNRGYEKDRWSEWREQTV